MLRPTTPEISAGYEGELWSAYRGDREVQVRWMGNHGKFFCRAYANQKDPENPLDARSFDYPHEVIDWLAMWFQNLSQEPT